MTDPRYRDATDEDIAFDYVLSLAGNDLAEIPDELEDDELEILAKVENGEMSMEEFLQYETGKYFKDGIKAGFEE